MLSTFGLNFLITTCGLAHAATVVMVTMDIAVAEVLNFRGSSSRHWQRLLWSFELVELTDSVTSAAVLSLDALFM